MKIILALAGFSACACGPEPVWLDLAGRDVSPPLIVKVSSTGEREITIEFSEKATVIQDELTFGPGVNSSVIRSEGNNAVIEVVDPLVPGSEYRLAARAIDAEGNSISFAATVSGFNGQVPEILINEVRTDGSGEKTDLVEFVVLSDGNLAGLAVMTGVPGNAEASFVFPAVTVKKDDIIILHSKKLGTPGEFDEINSITEASSPDSSPLARDFFCVSPVLFSKNNGCITVCSSREGTILDAFLYSNRKRDSDTKYSGFGTADFKTRAEACVLAGAWKSKEGAVLPEDCVPSSLITAARSFCRSSGSVDTNTSEDWHIVPTGKTSFGTMNSDTVQP